ncbi:MAG: polyketide cyclase, partial [Gammaproteobacteria bacterium]|nr:polyketide cyclase [Gammaproteobacteria bacterium]
MDLHVDSQLAAVERSVSSLERDGQPARAVTLARSYATTVEDLWDAVTTADRIA